MPADEEQQRRREETPDRQDPSRAGARRPMPGRGMGLRRLLSVVRSMRPNEAWRTTQQSNEPAEAWQTMRMGDSGVH